ncbi:MAG: hypothetical protein A2015_11390 [Spirochaetes bacterium GWF1_31_7]|nr:MAG: hypothetical protein A2Y30_15685 [Spirochaetes bacterium GWE1_32_154]OHD49026.1 MAG: hypothetical protein A2015_11390 [Spirochaetes bacterium GWF1_31_7]OHD50390.1 MAG: hypothetical protein A2Y29_13735 [Spirochaetes bacterium GWE2_31_10]OHD75716.1 MAG: hypothetical protein A2355_00395 [Spirochaetes bacterium RIFOXYB1_FULL_32_8]
MINSLLKYRGFALNAIKEQYAYKFKAMIWVMYDMILLFVQYFLWKAIFDANGGSLYDISIKQYVNYIVVGMVTARFLVCFIDGVIADEIKSGNIAMNFIKPYSYILMNIAKQVGVVVGGIIALTPLLIVSFLLVGFIDVSLLTVFYYIISVILAFFIIIFFNLILGICAFWITNYWGLRLLKWHFFVIFSGEMIAITMFFKIAENGIKNFPISVSEPIIQGFFKILGIMSYCLPFQAMGYTPTAIFTGLITGTHSILLHLGLQVIWVVVMLVSLILIWNVAKKQVTVLGG